MNHRPNHAPTPFLARQPVVGFTRLARPIVLPVRMPLIVGNFGFWRSVP